MKRVRVVVSGYVQGVGFRYAAAERARTSRVAGFVANRGDGTVEASFEGDDAAVDSMVAWCSRGPRGADVDDVTVDLETPQGEAGFRIR
jgi:acylphosphatase